MRGAESASSDVDALGRKVPGADLTGDLARFAPRLQDRRRAQWAVFLSAMIILALAPFATLPMPRIEALMPAFQGWSIFAEAMMAILLFSQFAVVRSPGLLVLASGCVFTGLAALGWMLNTPLTGHEFESSSPAAGLFFLIWTASFPVTAVIYSGLRGAQGLVRRDGEGQGRVASRQALLWVSVAMLAFIGLFVATATLGERGPRFFVHGEATLKGRLVFSLIFAVAILAIARCMRRAPRTLLDGWVLLSLGAWVFNTLISGLMSHSDFDLAWYAGRAYGALGSAALVTLLAVEYANQQRRAFEMHSALMASNEALHHLSRHDALTGLPNRRYFDSHLEQQYAVMRRYRRTLAVVIFDVDGFKNYNDAYGHQAGDICLARIGRALQSCCRRATDLAARYGGEEFAFILPETDLAAAMRLAEMAREAVEALSIPQSPGAGRSAVTVSAGVAVYDGRDVTSIEGVIAAADEALFHAKSRGRNRVASQSLNASRSRASTSSVRNLRAV